MHIVSPMGYIIKHYNKKQSDVYIVFIQHLVLAAFTAVSIVFLHFALLSIVTDPVLADVSGTGQHAGAQHYIPGSGELLAEPGSPPPRETRPGSGSLWQPQEASQERGCPGTYLQPVAVHGGVRSDCGPQCEVPGSAQPPGYLQNKGGR